MSELEDIMNSLQEQFNNSTDTPTDNGGAPDADAVFKEVDKIETRLQQTVSDIKEKVRLERIRDGRLKDKISESGKMGFYMIQAQVTDFQVHIVSILFCMHVNEDSLMNNRENETKIKRS